MGTNKQKLIIGFITYGNSTAKYLPYFLNSLKIMLADLEQRQLAEIKVLVQDNSETEDNENLKIIKINYSSLDFTWSGGNIGFARAYNQLIKKAIEERADYFLMFNPDMIFEPNIAREMLAAMQGDKKIGAIAPKTLYWNFTENKKADIIDSYGIFITPEHRFSDLYQGEQDKKEIITSEEVFGFTGAAALLRLEALHDVAYDNGNYHEYFDEMMFMYKEDCDLSYRLRLAGWKIIFCPSAVAYHHRTVAPVGESSWQIALNRAKKNKQVKKWAYLNHWVLLLKYMNLPFSWRVKMLTGWYQFKGLVFIFLFEQYLIGQLMQLVRMKKEIRQRREALKIKINISEIEKFMNKQI